ncbi:MAG TPA: hypothetical protein VFZ83_09325 [Acidimicrobiia bacterium]|nr:hypothetical protein [Acidimicrobiia bacterium]
MTERGMHERRRPKGLRGVFAVGLSLGLLCAAAVVATPAGAARPIIPDEPVPLSPAGQIIDATPTFTWAAADDAATYEVRVYRGKRVVASQSGISGTSWTSPVLPTNVDLSWKARGISATGKVGPYSSGQPTFRVVVPAVGDAWGGGLIAYVFQPGDPGYVADETHGLVVGPYPFSFGGGPNTGWYLREAWWRPCTSDFYGTITCAGGTDQIGTSTALGSGATNTAAIISYYNQAAPLPYSHAASIADSVSGNGYSDWYLPSKDELAKLHANRQVFIDNMNAGKPYMNFDGIAYATSFWSSSEVDSNLVWALNWNDPNPATAWFGGTRNATSAMIVFRTF